MTNNVDEHTRLNSANVKSRGKAVRERLADLGHEIPSTHVYEALATAYGYRNWPTLKAALDPAKDGSITIGRTRPVTVLSPDKPVTLTYEELTGNIEIVGFGPRTTVYSALVRGVLSKGGGLLLCDGQDSHYLSDVVTNIVSECGREKDLRILDFSNSELLLQKGVDYNPFQAGSAEELANLCLNCVGYMGLDDSGWRVQMRHLLMALFSVAVWLRDKGIIALDAPTVRDFLNLRTLIDLATGAAYSDTPAYVRKIVLGYLEALPGFDLGKHGRNQPNLPTDQHGYMEMVMTRALGTINGQDAAAGAAAAKAFKDALTKDTILIVKMAPVEKPGDSFSFLGKLFVSEFERHSAEREAAKLSTKPPFMAVFDNVRRYQTSTLNALLEASEQNNVSVVLGSQDHLRISALKKALTFYIDQPAAKVAQLVTSDRSVDVVLA